MLWGPTHKGSQVVTWLYEQRNFHSHFTVIFVRTTCVLLDEHFASVSPFQRERVTSPGTDAFWKKL